MSAFDDAVSCLLLQFIFCGYRRDLRAILPGVSLGLGGGIELGEHAKCATAFGGR